MTFALAAVPVLRAGLGMLDSVVEMFPEVAVGYIGLDRIAVGNDPWLYLGSPFAGTRGDTPVSSAN